MILRFSPPCLKRFFFFFHLEHEESIFSVMTVWIVVYNISVTVEVVTRGACETPGGASVFHIWLLQITQIALFIHLCVMGGPYQLLTSYSLGLYLNFAQHVQKICCCSPVPLAQSSNVPFACVCETHWEGSEQMLDPSAPLMAYTGFQVLKPRGYLINTTEQCLLL